MFVRRCQGIGFLPDTMDILVDGQKHWIKVKNRSHPAMYREL
jgi:hypothetical protein